MASPSSERPKRSTVRRPVEQSVENLLPISAYAFLKVSNSLTQEEKQKVARDDVESKERPSVSVRGIYHSEDQAYLAAIHNLVYLLEPMMAGDAAAAQLNKVRTIGTTDTLPAKDRFRSVLQIFKSLNPSCGGDDFLVMKVPLFPPEEIDLKEALKGRAIPFVYWDGSDDEEDPEKEYEPSEDDDDDVDDSDDDDDDDHDHVNGDGAGDVLQMEEDTEGGDRQDPTHDGRHGGSYSEP